MKSHFPTLSPAGLKALAQEVASGLGVPETDLADRLAYLVEARPEVWEKDFGSNPKLATKVSALLALGGVEGLVRPRLLDDYPSTACYLKLRHELSLTFPEERVPALEEVLQDLFCVIPRLVDLCEARRLLFILFDQPPSSLVSLLLALGAPDVLRVGDMEIDSVAAARTVREETGTTFTESLITSGVLHPVINGWVAERRSRFGPRAALEPVRVLAELAAEAGALLVFGAPSRPARWESTKPVISHLSRLARVLGLKVPPSICPRLDMLGHVVLDEEAAVAYDSALADDAKERAEEIIESEDCSEEEALRVATQRVMRGFHPFCDYLSRVAGLGAPITALPRGLAVDRRTTSLWQGIREDLCPRPEIYIEFLALAPELLADEPDGKLVLLQLLTAARSSVVLSLRPSYVFAVEEGYVIHVPWQANKTGTGLLFVPKAFADFFGFEPSWLDPDAPADPPQWRRDEFASAIEGLCRRFKDRTGYELPHQSIRFTRMALAQLYARHLEESERETITALLGHRRRETRANYLRALPEQLCTAYKSWRKS